LALAIIVAWVVVAGSPALARDLGTQTAAATVDRAALPAEARQTEEAIRRGGPFPYAKDGSVFGNRERQLPANSRGYYREYTVKTPSAQDRGARRIVCGGQQPTRPDTCYYTGDHYASFARIAQ